MYKAVFLDLDGTLLDDEKNISKENRDAIENAKEKDETIASIQRSFFIIPPKIKSIYSLQ